MGWVLGALVVGVLVMLSIYIARKLPDIVAAPWSAWLNSAGFSAAAIVPFLIFFIPGYYRGFAIVMYLGFPGLQLILVGVVAVMLWLILRGRKLLDPAEIDTVMWVGILNGLWISGIGVFLAGPIFGDSIATPRVGVGAGLLGDFMQIFYAPGLWLLHLVLIVLVTNQLPYILAGLIEVCDPHPAQNTVKQSITRKRPDYLVEQDLAAIMRSHRVDARELQILCAELSPFKKWLWRVRLGIRARKSADLASLAKAATEAHKHDTELGMAVHEMERARRVETNSPRRHSKSEQ